MAKRKPDPFVEALRPKPGEQPHEYTPTEVRERLLRHVCQMIRYWQAETKANEDEKIEGVAFSILVALDGSAMALPGFVVAPSPHETDKDFSDQYGVCWYPVPPEVPCDIAGNLHNGLHPMLKQMPKMPPH